MSALIESNYLPVGLTTDYMGTGKPISEFAPRMVDAGFTRALWCEKSSSGTGDYLYTSKEVEQIDALFNKLGIDIYQVHSPEGAYNGQYVSPDPIERQKGLEIIKNRIYMARDLGAKVVTLHAPHLYMNWKGGPSASKEAYYAALSELEKTARDAGIRIGAENIELTGSDSFDNFPLIEDALSKFDDKYLGITYDSGHGNIVKTHMDVLERNKDRIIETHLNDNSGPGATADGRFKMSPDRKSHSDDMHRMLFTGIVDYSRLAKIFAQTKNIIPLTSEASQKYDSEIPIELWLKLEKENLEAFSRMINNIKAGSALDPSIIGSHRVRVLSGFLENPIGK